MSLIVILLITIGMVLIYSAMKNKKPQDVIKEALKRGK